MQRAFLLLLGDGFRKQPEQLPRTGTATPPSARYTRCGVEGQVGRAFSCEHLERFPKLAKLFAAVWAPLPAVEIQHRGTFLQPLSQLHGPAGGIQALEGGGGGAHGQGRGRERRGSSLRLSMVQGGRGEQQPAGYAKKLGHNEQERSGASRGRQMLASRWPYTAGAPAPEQPAETNSGESCALVPRPEKLAPD